MMETFGKNPTEQNSPENGANNSPDGEQNNGQQKADEQGGSEQNASNQNAPAADANDGQRETIRQTLQAGDPSRLRRPVDKEKIFIVDEEREVSVTVLYSTVTFRPNQQLREKRDARLIEIAKANSIRLRTR